MEGSYLLLAKGTGVVAFHVIKVVDILSVSAYIQAVNFIVTQSITRRSLRRFRLSVSFSKIWAEFTYTNGWISKSYYCGQWFRRPFRVLCTCSLTTKTLRASTPPRYALVLSPSNIRLHRLRCTTRQWDDKTTAFLQWSASVAAPCKDIHRPTRKDLRNNKLWPTEAMLT